MTPHFTHTSGAIGVGTIVTILIAVLNFKTAKTNADAANRDKPAPRKKPRARRK